MEEIKVEVYLREPKGEVRDPNNSLEGRAWARSQGLPPLTNEEYRTWSEFLPHREHSRYLYCAHCGGTNVVGNGGYGVQDRLLPPEVVTVKERCIAEGKAQWLTLRASTNQNALFATIEGGIFFVAQWGRRLYTTDEVIGGVRTRARIRRHNGNEILLSVLLFGGGLGITLASPFFLNVPPEEFKFYIPLSLALIPPAICVGVYEHMKRKLRRQFAFMF